MSIKEQRDEEFTNKWFERINAANRYFDDWSKRFKCKQLNDYIEGKQGAASGCRYVLNLIYSSIKIKKPSLLFTNPEYRITPKPWKTDWNPELAYRIARLKEDTLNTFVQDSNIKISQEIDMAILDSWSYFGMVEVGYGANWIINPNAGKPILKSDYEEDLSDKDYGKTLVEPDEIPEKEYVYVKRIPAFRFRVGGSDSFDLTRCNWAGYYEWVRTEDIVANKKFLKNVNKDFDWAGGRSDDYYFDASHEEKDIESSGDYSKVWKIWDIRKKEFNIFNSSPQKWIYSSTFDRLPLFGLKFDNRQTGWYPIPVIYNWKPPQDEYNESREQLRQYRRRARQTWQVMKDTIDPDEKDKFIHAPDATIIEVKRDQAIQPINNAPLDASIANTMQLGSQEFDKISATSNNQRGVSDRTTATEASTIETRSRVREDADRVIVANWLAEIGKEMLNVIIENFTNEFFIKQSHDEGEMGEEVNLLNEVYSIINPADLDDGSDYNVTINVQSMSPVVNEVDERSFLKFMSVLQNFPILSMHPSVIREAAYKCNYRNEKVIAHLSEMARLAMIAKIAEGQAQMNSQNAYAQNLDQGQPNQAALNGGNMGQNVLAQETGGDIEAIRQMINGGYSA